MPTPIVAGNWKMNTVVPEAIVLAAELRNALDAISGVEKVVCPPFVSLMAVKGLLDGTSVKVGAQNMHHAEKGALYRRGIAGYVGRTVPVRHSGPLGAAPALR